MVHWTHLMRQTYREQNKIPYYVPVGDDDPQFKRLYVEDDASTPDREHVEEAWRRIFDEPWRHTSTALYHYDSGDYDVYLYPGNRVYVSSYDGASLYQFLPERKF